ncbi:hypothetical protein ACQPZF_27940 [Actinosynnema sp. CS-041913]|uniref:hypothetical protein n=1 Tax=Actinosynnema sp. CS-041913 TaxID=3239917 RepID=UPI003D908DC7
MSRPDESEVDQLVFAPGEHGVGCRGTSLPPGPSRGWENLLLPLSRIQSYNTGDMPDTSLSYFAFDRFGVAVVRRSNDGWSNGRNSAHAVVGPAAVLTPRRALSMASWDGWLSDADPARPMERLAGSDLPDGATDADRPPSGWLTALVAAHLREPRGNLTVVGAGDADRIPLLRGLVDVLAAVWAGSDLTRRWTFSTHEQSVDHKLKNAAEVIFLPGYEPGATKFAGTLVRLDSAPADGWEADAAATLVGEYLRSDPAALFEGLARARVPESTDVAGRLAALRHLAERRSGREVALTARGPDRSADATQELRLDDAQRGDAAGVGTTQDAPSVNATRDYHAGPGTTHDFSGVGATHRPAGLGGPETGGVTPNPGPSRLELVRELRAAENPDQAARLVAALDEAGPEESQGQRYAIRGELLNPRFTGGRLDAIGYRAAGVYPVVTRLCFGDRMEDLRLDDRTTLAEVGDLVVDNRTSSFLVRAMVERSVAAGKADLLVPAFGVRELRHQGLPVATPDWSVMWCADPDAHRPPPEPPPTTATPATAVLPTVVTWPDALRSFPVMVLMGALLFVVGLLLGVTQGA